MPEAVIVSTARSPIGRAMKGSMTTIRPDDLTVHNCNGTGGEQCYLVLVASETLGVSASVPITFGSPK